MAYDSRTICALAKSLGFPKVSDPYVKALLSMGRRVRWRAEEYSKLYAELIEDCLVQHLSWSDCEEAAMVYWVRLREHDFDKMVEHEKRLINRIADMHNRGLYDDEERAIRRLDNIVFVKASIRADIDAIKSRFPNADWDF
jgi:hypothetical protein